MKKIVLFIISTNWIISQLFSQSNCPNSDFSQGDFTNWEGYYGDFYNPAEFCGFAANRHVINTIPGSYDPIACNELFSFAPGETHSARLGNSSIGAEAEQLRYSITVTPETNLFIYKYAVVLEDPGHIASHQPSFTIEVTDENGIIIDPVCGYYYVYAQQGLPGWSNCGGVVWKDWTTVGLNLDPYLGENIAIVFTTRDCEETGHFGYAYLSASCGKLQMEINYCPQESSATMTAPNGFTYLWSNGQTSQSITVNDPTPGADYSCLLTAVNGCQVTVSTYLNATLVSSDFSFITNCVDHSVDFTDLSTTNQNEIVNLEWDFGDGSTPITGVPNPIHYFSNSGTYNVKLIAFSTDGCSDTTVKSVFVYPLPFIQFYQNTLLIATDTAVLCPLDSVITLNVNNGEININYHWTKKSEPGWFSNSPFILLSNPGMGSFIESYYCKVENEYNCISEDTIHVLWDFTGCVGINETMAFISGIYPNPSNGLINIDFKQILTNLKIELFNLEGNLMYNQNREEFHSNQLIIDLAQYPRGVYYLRISSEGNSETQKIILN